MGSAVSTTSKLSTITNFIKKRKNSDLLKDIEERQTPSQSIKVKRNEDDQLFTIWDMEEKFMPDRRKSRSVLDDMYVSTEVDGVSQKLKPEQDLHVLSADGKYIYHVSIIDYLQTYNTEKKLERWGKIIKMKLNFLNFLEDETETDPYMISSISPDEYQKRFMNFVMRTVFKNIV